MSCYAPLFVMMFESSCEGQGRPPLQLICNSQNMLGYASETDVPPAMLSPLQYHGPLPAVLPLAFLGLSLDHPSHAALVQLHHDMMSGSCWTTWLVRKPAVPMGACTQPGLAVVNGGLVELIWGPLGLTGVFGVGEVYFWRGPINHMKESAYTRATGLREIPGTGLRNWAH